MKKLKKILMLPLLLTHHSQGFAMETEVGGGKNKRLIYSRKSGDEKATFAYLQDLFSQNASPAKLQKPVDAFQMAVHSTFPDVQYQNLLEYAKAMQQSSRGTEPTELPDLVSDIKEVMKGQYAANVIGQWTNTASKSIIDRFNAAPDKFAALETLGAYKAVSDSYNCFAACTNWNVAQNKTEKAFYKALTVLAYKQLLKDLGLSSLEGTMDWRGVVAPADAPPSVARPVPAPRPVEQEVPLPPPPPMQQAVDNSLQDFHVKVQEMQTIFQGLENDVKGLLDLKIQLNMDPSSGSLKGKIGASRRHILGKLNPLLQQHQIALHRENFFADWIKTLPKEQQKSQTAALEGDLSAFVQEKSFAISAALLSSLLAKKAFDFQSSCEENLKPVLQSLTEEIFPLGRTAASLKQAPPVSPAVSQQRDPLEKRATFPKPFQEKLKAFNQSFTQFTAHDSERKIAALYGKIAGGIDQRVQGFVQQMDWDKLEGWRPGSDKPQITQLLVQLSDEIKHRTPFGAEIDLTLIPDLKERLQGHPAQGAMETAWIEAFPPQTRAALYEAKQTAQWEATKTQMKMYEAMLDSMSLNLCVNAVKEIEGMLQKPHLGLPPTQRLLPADEAAVRLNLTKKELVYQALVNLFQGVYVPGRLDITGWVGN